MDDLQTNTSQQQPAPPPTYRSDVGGLRQAASDVMQRRREADGTEPDVTEVKSDTEKFPDRIETNSDGDETNRGITVRDAAKSVSEERRQREAARIETLKALGHLPDADASPGGEEAAPADAHDARQHDVGDKQQARQDIYQAALEVQWVQAARGFLQAFPEFHTPQGAEQLRQQDPARYLAATEAAAAIKSISEAHNAVADSAKKRDSAEFEAWAKQQGEITDQKAPELKDPVLGPKLRAAALEVLKDVGIAEDDLPALWRGEKPISLVDHRAQLIVLKATRYDMMVKQARTIRAEPKPPVQRPGTRDMQGQSSEIDSLRREANKNPTPRTLARVLAASRRASQGKSR